MKRIATVTLSILLTGNALAEPEVISDSGATYPIKPYMEAFNTEGDVQEETNALPTMLPIRTKSMSAGRVKARKVDHPYLSAPLFIIGYDKNSVAWLKKNKSKLLSIGAVGMIVNVENKFELSQLAAMTEGLQVVPVSGTQFAQQYGLKHYPVLITKTEISQ